jgi:hypothetical protein
LPTEPEAQCLRHRRATIRRASRRQEDVVTPSPTPPRAHLSLDEADGRPSTLRIAPSVRRPVGISSRFADDAIQTLSPGKEGQAESSGHRRRRQDPMAGSELDSASETMDLAPTTAAHEGRLLAPAGIQKHSANRDEHPAAAPIQPHKGHDRDEHPDPCNEAWPGARRCRSVRGKRRLIRPDDSRSESDDEPLDHLVHAPLSFVLFSSFLFWTQLNATQHNAAQLN